MPTLAKQIRRFNCVIECLPSEGQTGARYTDFDQISATLKDLSRGLPCSYWAIVHDQDLDEETGQIKRPHIHLVMETQTRHTCLGVVRSIADGFGINQNRVSVRECKHLKLAIRYLTHLDDPEKAVYNPFDIIHNEQETLSEAMLSANDDLTIEALEKAIRSSRNEKELAYKIGLHNYNRYRATIRDLAPIIMEEKAREHDRALLREGEKCVQERYRQEHEGSPTS